MHPKKRVALHTFWEYIEHELEELLGSERTSHARRVYGTDEHVDTEGEVFCADIGEELPCRAREDGKP